MNLNGNTIFITGGGSGIGRGSQRHCTNAKTQVIISGRRKSHLEATTKANPGMASPTVNTNLLGSIRVTSALIEHLKKQPAATIVYNTSVLALAPMAATS